MSRYRGLDRTISGRRRQGFRHVGLLPPGFTLTHQGDPQGVTSLVAKGTAAPVFARSGTRLVRRYASGAYGYVSVADGVVPVGVDVNGNYYIDCEPSDTEYCLQSTDVNSWIKTRGTTPSSITGPLDLPAYVFTEQNDGAGPATTHHARSPASALGDTNGQKVKVSLILAAGDRYILQVWLILGGAENFTAVLNLNEGTGTSAHFTNIAVKTLGTFSGKAFKLYTMDCVSSSGAGNSYIYLHSSIDPFNLTYIGNGSTCFYAAYVGLRMGATIPSFSSPIITTTASVTRNADAFRYVGDDGNLGGVGSDKRGTLRLKIVPDDITLGAVRTLFSLNDGGSAADEILFTAAATTGYVSAKFTASGGTVRTVTGPNVDVFDGASAGHVIQLSYQAGKATLWVDGTAGATNTDLAAADIPDDIDRMVYGYVPIADEKFYNPPVWRAI